MTTEWEARRVSNWETVWDGVYSRKDNSDPEFNIAAWLSSYTGQPISALEMQEWVRCSVDRVLALLPKDSQEKSTILEIGCGTGLLLYRLASHVQTFIWIDPSENVLKELQENLDRKNCKNVVLQKNTATEISAIQKNSVDVIVLNSVCQYFPSVQYMLKVIEQALPLLKPGGSIFLGDLRNFDLFNTFHTSVVFEKSSDALSVEKLKQQIERRKLKEPELLYHPRFFLSLGSRFSETASVDAQVRSANFINEMSMFRYDVTIRKKASSAANATFSCDNFRNNRVQKYLVLEKLLTENKQTTVGELRQALKLELEKTQPRETTKALTFSLEETQFDISGATNQFAAE